MWILRNDFILLVDFGSAGQNSGHRKRRGFRGSTVVVYIPSRVLSIMSVNGCTNVPAGWHEASKVLLNKFYIHLHKTQQRKKMAYTDISRFQLHK